MLDHFMLVRTIGFISEIPEETQAKIMRYALPRISPETNWVVLDPEAEENRLEDEGKTRHCANPFSNKKIYVILDDFGDPQKWTEMYEPEIVESLRKAPNCQYTITFLLAEEY